MIVAWGGLEGGSLVERLSRIERGMGGGGEEEEKEEQREEGEGGGDHTAFKHFSAHF